MKSAFCMTSIWLVDLFVWPVWFGWPAGLDWFGLPVWFGWVAGWFCRPVDLLVGRLTGLQSEFYSGSGENAMNREFNKNFMVPGTIKFL